MLEQSSKPAAKLVSRRGKYGLAATGSRGEREKQRGGGGQVYPERVLFAISLNPSDKFGSLEAQILALARVFKDLGSSFVPIFSSPLGAKVMAEYQMYGLPVGHLDLNRFKLTTLIHLIRLIYRNKIHIVHWNFYRPRNWYVLSLAIMMPWVEHYLTDHNSRYLPIRNSRDRMRKTVNKLLFMPYSKVLGVSNFVVSYLQAQGTRSRVSRWHNLVSTERFRPDPVMRTKRRADLDVEGRFVLAVVAHLVKPKGVDVAIRAMGELPDNIVLLVIGTGVELEPLRDLCKQLSLESRVKILGLQWDIAPYLQAADCLICPSVWAEASGYVILEGLACSLPVVASAVGGIPELIADGKTGFLVPPGDSRALSARIRYLYNTPEVCKRIGMEARAAAIKDFSLERRIDENLQVYQA